MDKGKTPKKGSKTEGLTFEDIERMMKERYKLVSKSPAEVSNNPSAKGICKIFKPADQHDSKRQKTTDGTNPNKPPDEICIQVNTRKEKMRVYKTVDVQFLTLTAMKLNNPEFNITRVDNIEFLQETQNLKNSEEDKKLLTKPLALTGREEIRTDDNEGRKLHMDFYTWLEENEAEDKKSSSEEDDTDEHGYIPYMVMNMEKNGLKGCNACGRPNYKCHKTLYGPYALNEVMNLCATEPERCECTYAIKKTYIDTYNRALAFDNFRKNGTAIPEDWKYPPLCM